MIDIGKFMQQDRILMLALDHRGSLEKMLPDSVPSEKRREKTIEFKRMLMQSLAPLYSGVLLDPDYGLSAYRQSTRAEVKEKPYLFCIEKSGYEDTGCERLTELEYSVSQLKTLGAKGVKLLLFYRPDVRTSVQQIALTKKVFTECKNQHLPFFLEILNYSLDGKPYDASNLVPRSVKNFLDNGIAADVFKLEFPGTAAACKEVTAFLGKTPWILLTKGDTYEGFVASLKVAAANGARGFLAGRSIWQDVMQKPLDEWSDYIETTVKKRFNEICTIASST